MTRSLISSLARPVERPDRRPRRLALSARQVERAPGAFVVDLRPSDELLRIPPMAGATAPTAVERFVGFVDDQTPDVLSLELWRVPDGVRFWVDVPRGARGTSVPSNLEDYAVLMWSWSEADARERNYWIEWERLPDEPAPSVTEGQAEADGDAGS